MPQAPKPAPSAVAAVLEVVVGTVLVAVAIAAVEWAAGAIPGFGPWAGAAVAATFLCLPLIIAYFRGFSGDPLGIGHTPVLPSIRLGILAVVAIAVPFVLGYDVLATHYFEQSRFGGPGLFSFGEVFQGTPPATADRVLIYEEGHGLAVANHTDAALSLHVLRPATAQVIILQPGRRHVLSAAQARRWSLQGPANTPPLTARILLGGGRVPLSALSDVVFVDGNPVFELSRQRLWLLWYLLTQLLVVAMPEEAFFRGWVLGRLRGSLATPRHTILGVPFGRAHVLSAVLFALIHLVVTPAPHRLLVFFPGLLFAWLAERSRTIIAPVVHHAFSNMLLRIAMRTYL